MVRAATRTGTTMVASGNIWRTSGIRAMFRLFFEMYRTPSARSPRRTNAIFRMWRAKNVVNSWRGRDGHGTTRSARTASPRTSARALPRELPGLSKSICIPSPCARGFNWPSRRNPPRTTTTGTGSSRTACRDRCARRTRERRAALEQQRRPGARQRRDEYRPLIRE